jgi:hypothetical protein
MVVDNKNFLSDRRKVSTDISAFYENNILTFSLAILPAVIGSCPVKHFTTFKF